MGNFCTREYDESTLYIERCCFGDNDDTVVLVEGDIKNKYTLHDGMNQYIASDGKMDKYIFYDAMDDNNKKAMDIQESEGWGAAIKHMMTGEDGKTRSYAEMRSLYG